MARKFNELRGKMSPIARDLSVKRKKELLEEIPLQELRQARSLSQEDLAAVLKVKQSTVSKMERETDMYLSTLRRFIRAMGGTLDLVARFPEGDVKIRQFKDIDSDASNEKRKKRDRRTVLFILSGECQKVWMGWKYSKDG